MAKRGRPSKGGTTVIGVPRNIYLLLAWVAACERKSVADLVASVARTPLAERYKKLLPDIKKRKAAADKLAEIDGKEPLPLPDQGEVEAFLREPSQSKTAA
jgi:hypothetical protein